MGVERRVQPPDCPRLAWGQPRVGLLVSTGCVSAERCSRNCVFVLCEKGSLGVIVCFSLA